MTDSRLIQHLAAQNKNYSDSYSSKGIPGQAGKGLLLLTCMDSRIVPHEIFGLEIGDMKVIRNAGGQLNPEVERDIVLASHILNCHTVVILPHILCGDNKRTFFCTRFRTPSCMSLPPSPRQRRTFCRQR